MSYHIFQKRDSQSVFSTKKEKSNQNQNHTNRKECHEHYTIFMIFETFCMKVVYICIPKKSCIDFSLKMWGPLKESTSCFLIRLNPLVLVPIGMFRRTQSPRFYLSKTIIVFFMLSKGDNAFIYISKTIIVFCLPETIKVICSFIFQRLS